MISFKAAVAQLIEQVILRIFRCGVDAAELQMRRSRQRENKVMSKEYLVWCFLDAVNNLTGFELMTFISEQ